MHARQYHKFKQLMKLPLSERRQIALSAQGELQLILTYDHRLEVLEALLDNPNLMVQSIINLAKKRIVPPAFLERIINKREWISQYDIKLELVKNPRTPTHHSLNLLKYLYRNDIQLIARDVSVSHIIRQVAVSLLEAKLADLLPGEKVSLAKDAVGPLLTILLNDEDRLVVRAALNNARLRENEVVVMVSKKKTRTEIVQAVYDSRWSRRYAVIVALAHNPNTPQDIIREVVPRLLQQDLQQMIHNPTLSISIRTMARHMLRRRILSLSQKQMLRLAKTGRREILNILIEKEDLDILKSTEGNPNLSEGHVVSLAVKTDSADIIEYLGQYSPWRTNMKVRQALFNNPNTPQELRDTLTRREINDD